MGAIIATNGPSNGGSSMSDLEKLRGTWLTVSLMNNGKTLVDEKSPQNEGPITKLSYEGNQWMILVGGDTVANGIFSIDDTKKPKQIDIMDESGATNEKTALGIYEIDGDTYKYCLGAPGKPRPKDFTSKAGDGASLGVMKREKP